MSFFDSHAHIGAPEMLEEAGSLLSRARAAGVRGVIAVGAGYGLTPNADAIRLAEGHADVWATAGLHPHDAADWSPEANTQIESWLEHEKVVAVGECGLDYFYENSPREAQRECLRAQIGLAKRSGLPLVIHVRPAQDTRDAFEDLLRIFDEEGAEKCGGVIHCFTGDLPFARDCLAREFDISFSGILTFKNAQALREVAAALPLDRLLIETDSPLLAPVPHRGGRNEPAYVVEVAEALADLHDKTVQEVAQRTHERGLYAFRIQDAA